MEKRREYQVKVILRWHREAARRRITGATFDSEVDAETYAREVVRLGAKRAEVTPAQVLRPTVDEAIEQFIKFKREGQPQ